MSSNSLSGFDNGKDLLKVIERDLMLKRDCKHISRLMYSMLREATTSTSNQALFRWATFADQVWIKSLVTLQKRSSVWDKRIHLFEPTCAFCII